MLKVLLISLIAPITFGFTNWIVGITPKEDVWKWLLGCYLVAVVVNTLIYSW